MSAIPRRNEELPEEIMKEKTLSIIEAATRSQGEKTGKPDTGKTSLPGLTKVVKSGDAKTLRVSQ